MQLTTDDKMAGLETPSGETFKPDANGIITLPERLDGYGRQAARSAPMFHVRTKGYAGFNADELAARYDEWEQTHRSDTP